MMLHTKYQGSRPYGFRLEDFRMFFLYSLRRTCDPQGGPFLAPGNNLNKFGRSLLSDATYQNIRALGLMGSGKFFFFNVSPYISIC